MRVPGFITFFILVVWALPAAGPATAMPSVAVLKDASRLLESWDLKEASDLIDRHLKSDPDDSTVLYLKARAAFYLGDYSGALDILEGLGDSWINEYAAGFGDLVRDTASAVGRMTPHYGEHFIIFADEEKDWVLVEPGLRALESSWRNLGEFFGVYPDSPIRVEIYPDAGKFQKASSLSVRDIETSGAIGICKFNKIMVLSPRALVRGYRWMDTLAHEYIHYLVVRLTGNSAPIWVHEGIARYFEHRWKKNSEFVLSPGGSTLLAGALEEDRLIPFEAMDPSLVKLDSSWDVALAFAECATAVDFILSRKGREGILSFLAGIRENGPEGTRQALNETVNLDFAAFEEAWKVHVAGLGLKKTEHIRIEGYRLAENGREEDLMNEIQSRAAANHLRLGDRFRMRDRLKPALIEYKRAYRESPGSVYIINKVAIAASLLGDHQTSIEYLKKALEISPGYPLTYKTLGDVHARQGSIEDALGSYSEYNEINPFNPEIYFSRGMVYKTVSRIKEALADWEICMRLNPEDENLRSRIEAAGGKINR